MKPCYFTLEGIDKPFPGITDETTWNGFDNVWVTPTTHAQIVVELRELAKKHGWDKEDLSGIDELPVGDNGYVSLANGYCTTRVRFSHAYDFAFELTSDDPDAADVTPEMIRQACINRINNLPNREIHEAWIGSTQRRFNHD